MDFIVIVIMVIVIKTECWLKSNYFKDIQRINLDLFIGNNYPLATTPERLKMLIFNVNIR
jgi:hypothetical protein